MIRVATKQDLPALAALATLLWNTHTAEELSAELGELLSDADAQLFLYIENGELVGFAQCQLRHDYVEGTSGSPVGYLEGVFVREAYRRNGAATALLHACEQWSRTKGCAEFASDCEWNNENSRRFHLHAGFTEANTIICFVKPL